MKTPVPLMSNCPNYTHWKNLIKVWLEVTDVAKEKLADQILLTLDTDGQNLVFQVPEAERRDKDGKGVDKILLKLDTLYDKNTTQKLFSAFEKWEVYRRTPEMSLSKYISGFEMKIQELKDLKVTLPESLLAFRLLKYAGLSEDVARIVRVACNTNATGAEGLTLEIMKTTMLNAFDCRLEPSTSSFGSSQPEVTSVEPFQIKSEPQDTFFARESYNNPVRGAGRDQRGKQRMSRDPYPTSNPRTRRDSDRFNKFGERGRYRDGDRGGFRQGDRSRRVNRIDSRTGDPSKCRLCGSIYHWERQCSRTAQSEEKMRYDGKSSTLEAYAVNCHDQVDINLLAQTFNQSL